MTPATPDRARAAAEADGLKPCPWCGPRVTFDPFVAYADGRYYVACPEPCETCGPSRNTRDEAIAAWNRRAPASPSAAAGGEDYDALAEALRVMEQPWFMDAAIPGYRRELLAATRGLRAVLKRAAGARP